MLHEDRQGTASGEAEQANTVAKRSVPAALVPARVPAAFLPRTSGFTEAATLASNISGANDGAGPAAATIAGAKLAVGAAAVAAFSTMGGAGTAGLIGRGLGKASGGYGVPGAVVRSTRGAARYVSPRVADLARRFAGAAGRDA